MRSGPKVPAAKMSTRSHPRFICGSILAASSLPPPYKERLLKLRDHRISEEGVLTIKAQQSRSQDQNRDDAIERLRALIQSVAVPRKQRRANGADEEVRRRGDWRVKKKAGRIEGVQANDRITVRASIAVADIS